MFNRIKRQAKSANPEICLMRVHTRPAWSKYSSVKCHMCVAVSTTHQWCKMLSHHYSFILDNNLGCQSSIIKRGEKNEIFWFRKVYSVILICLILKISWKNPFCIDQGFSKPYRNGKKKQKHFSDAAFNMWDFLHSKLQIWSSSAFTYIAV